MYVLVIIINNLASIIVVNIVNFVNMGRMVCVDSLDCIIALFSLIFPKEKNIIKV